MSKIAFATIAYFTHPAIVDLFWKSFDTFKTSHEAITINIINHAEDFDTVHLGNRINFVIRNDKNNVSRAWNTAIDLAKSQDCDYVFISNSDVMYQPGSFDKLIEFSNNSDYYITGHHLYKDAQYVFPHNGSIWYCSFMLNLNKFEEFQSKDPEIPELSGGRKGYFNDVLFDPAYYEDIDYQRRINLSGMKTGVCEEAKAYHLGSQTKVLDNRELRKIESFYPRCRENYIAEWGGDIDLETYLTPYNR